MANRARANPRDPYQRSLQAFSFQVSTIPSRPLPPLYAPSPRPSLHPRDTIKQGLTIAKGIKPRATRTGDEPHDAIRSPGSSDADDENERALIHEQDPKDVAGRGVPGFQRDGGEFPTAMLDASRMSWSCC